MRLRPKLLWYRLSAAALIPPLAWEPPYTTAAALKRRKKKKKRKLRPHPLKLLSPKVSKKSIKGEKPFF